MRVAPACVITLLVAVSSVRAQSDETTAPVSPVRTYSLLRENEDWSFLKDPSLRQDFWDPIKYIPLRDGRIGISRSAVRSGKYSSKSVTTTGANSRT